MIDPRDQHDDPGLDAYLDGVIPTEDRAGVEARLSSEPVLQRQVETQRRIDDCLRRHFEPAASGRLALELNGTAAAAPAPAMTAPSAAPAAASRVDQTPAIAGRIEPAATPAEKPHRSQWRLGLIAAVLLLGAGAIYYFGPLGPGRSDPEDFYKGRPRPTVVAQRPTADTYYASIVSAGFKPLWVCKDDEEFKKTTRDRLGASLLVKPDPTITLVGWTYGESPMSDDTSVLLARVDGKEVVVLLDRAGGNCRSVAQPDPSSSLHVYKRTIAGVTMYEISPRDASAVIDRVYDAGA